MTRHIILYGGGLDSTALFLHLRCRLQLSPLELFFVDYGQKAAQPELMAACYFGSKYDVKVTRRVLDMGYSTATILRGTVLGTAQSNRLELRNVRLLSLAASYAATVYKSAILYVGFHKEPLDSGYLDAKTEYLTHLEKAFAAATSVPLAIEAPFSHMERHDILKLGHTLDPDILTHSHTCYEEKVCGECPHCLQKKAMIEGL
jgi:7-cyano-7-deazaguanine synthase in queuosine biosynthesis